MSATRNRRHVDFQLISDWIEPGSRVLDLGCGRGLLLEFLYRKKDIWGVGVDVDPAKVLGCLQRGLSVFQGDALSVLKTFPDDFFDRVICSRTVEELEDPFATLFEGLRVGRRLTVGFVNYAYWRNRISHLVKGRRIRNSVYPDPWYLRRPSNPFSLLEFEAFCRDQGVTVHQRMALRADWSSPCRLFPGFLCGYAIFDLGREGSAVEARAPVAVEGPDEP